jgi:uncharacterized protein (DUF302 family)
MKILVGFIIGLVVGAILAGVLAWNLMPGMMLKEYPASGGVAETVEKIKEKALSEGWVVASVKPLHESIRKNGGGDIRPMMLVNLCEANHAFDILELDENKKISVFMPCTISVYEKSDGQTYIGAMNAGLLGRMFGGRAADVMKMVSSDQQSFIEYAR